MPDITIALREWQSLPPDPGSPTHAQFLPNHPNVRALANSLARQGVIDVQERRTGVHITTTSYVGVLQLGHLRIVIEPKIRGIDLMRLFRYAYGLRDLRLLTQVAPSIGGNAFLDLLIQQLLAEVNELVARGLHRRYQPAAARLTSPRGRLDLPALARDAIITAELPCRHHPRIEDCLHNQVLLAGLRLAATLAHHHDLRSRLRRTAAAMEPAVTAIRLSQHVIDELRRQLNRLTIAYEPAVSLIEILVESSGLSLQGEQKEPRLPGFLFDMNRFFQRLLGRFLRDHLPDHHVQEEQSIRTMMAYSPENNPRARRAPAPRPDYCIKRPGGQPLLLDAKYRDLWNQALPESMLYQLAIYALSQSPPGRATILYPTIDAAARDSVIRILDPTTGASRAEVVQRPVNLTRLAELVTPNHSAGAARRTHEFARELIAAPS